MRKASFLAAVLLSLVIGPAAAQTTWYVDDDNCPGPGTGTPGDPFCAIQAGIDAASAGHTVLIADGTYSGEGNYDLDFGGKAITVRSANGPDNCTIDCQDLGHRGFHFHSGESASAVLEGLTITGGWGGDAEVDGMLYPSVGGGIYCDGASPTINDCVITDNEGRYLGGGVALVQSAASLNNCTISLNRTVYVAGGGVVLSNSQAVLTECTISGNTISLAAGEAQGSGGGVYSSSSDNSSLIECTISENSAKHAGGAYCPHSNLILTNCTIRDNIADSGGGIIGRDGADLTLTNCLIQDNTALYGGGGFYSDDNSAVEMTNCLITGNAAIYYSGGGAFLFRTDANLTNCTFSNNDANKAGGMYCRWGTVTLLNCILWDDLPAEIFVAPTNTTVTVTYSNVEGGWTGNGNLNDDPQFVSGFYLSQVLAGQPANSPCVDAGDPGSSLISGTTRTDLQLDSGVVDMGYHHPAPSSK